MQIINYPSPNFDDRASSQAVDMIILHYTDVASIYEALEILIDPQKKVSAHYVIDVDGTIYKLVSEGKRAWHAGISEWQNQHNLNNNSIGIELQNGGFFAGFNLNGVWPPFPKPQIKSLVNLLSIIMAKYNIPKNRILGHSDVAPARKIDPGPAFPWEKLLNSL